MKERVSMKGISPEAPKRRSGSSEERERRAF
jgi:hypothetical protein